MCAFLLFFHIYLSEALKKIRGYEMLNLIKEFIDADLECLLPDKIEEYLYENIMNDNLSDSEEVFNFQNEFHHSRLYDEYEPDVFDLESNTYLDDYDDYDDFEDDDRDEYHKEINTNMYFNKPKSLEDMKYMFGMEDESDEVFLNHSISDLFGISKTQLKFIDADFLVSGNLSSLVEFLRDKKEMELHPDVQQRIKLAQVNSFVKLNARFYIYDNDLLNKESNKKIVEQLYNIALHKDINEAVQIIRKYHDYLGMLHDCSLYNRTLEESERKTYPVVIKPSHLADWHNKALQDYRAYNTLVQQQNRERFDLMIKERYSNRSYNRFFYEFDNFFITGPSCYDDFVKEGNQLDHCVESYASQHAEGRTNIYFLRRKDSPDSPYYTLEVFPDKGKYLLEQCFGYSNTTDKSDECKKFILEWTRTKRIKIECAI